MYLKCNAKIIKEDERIINLISFEITSTIENRTTTGTIVIPRYYASFDDEKKQIYKAIELPNTFKKGEKISLTTYYTDEWKEDKIIYQKDMYVTKTEIDGNKINVSVEDEMYNLKSAEDLISVDYLDPKQGGSPGEKDLIKFLKKLIEAKGYNVQIFPEDLTYETTQYSFIELNIVQILKYMYDNYMLGSFFIDNNTIIIGRIYQGQKGLETSNHNVFSFLYDKIDQVVESHSLVYFDDSNSNTEIEAKNYLSDNTVITKNVFTGHGDVGRKIDAVFYNLDNATFLKNVEELKMQKLNKGFEGTMTTFGNYLSRNEAANLNHNFHYVKILDTISFTNLEYSNKVDMLTIKDLDKDIYLVESVIISFTNSGIRQEIGIGKQLN